jgi:subtilase family serine protease
MFTNFDAPRRFLRLAFPCVVSALFTGCGAAQFAPVTGTNSTDDVRQQVASGSFVQACPDVPAGEFRCLALGLREGARALRTAMPDGGSVPGYGPGELQAAYNTKKEALDGSGGTVAIVDAYGNPYLAKDLATYRRQFGLPKCDEGSRCLRVVNQNGQPSPLPKFNRGWASEQSIDVDMVSANCPKCHILMVQADSEYGNALFIAEKTAASFKPRAISNSWGGEEYPGEVVADSKYFYHPGIAITASAGDSGYGVSYPAASIYATAVGGTSLYPSRGSRKYTENVWAGTGSGCSAYEQVPPWQIRIEQRLGGCWNRITSDVAYLANPFTGIAVYASFSDGEPPGWQIWGGTSVGAPAIAAMYALAGKPTRFPVTKAYSKHKDLYDITTGSNGGCAPFFYLCTAQRGYDGPTGNGTPNGLAAF